MALNNDSLDSSYNWPPDDKNQPLVNKVSQVTPLSIYSNEYAEKRKIIRHQYLLSLKNVDSANKSSHEMLNK